MYILIKFEIRSKLRQQDGPRPQWVKGHSPNFLRAVSITHMIYCKISPSLEAVIFVLRIVRILKFQSNVIILNNYHSFGFGTSWDLLINVLDTEMGPYYPAVASYLFLRSQSRRVCLQQHMFQGDLSHQFLLLGENTAHHEHHNKISFIHDTYKFLRISHFSRPSRLWLGCWGTNI